MKNFLQDVFRVMSKGIKMYRPSAGHKYHHHDGRRREILLRPIPGLNAVRASANGYQVNYEFEIVLSYETK
jgi:hypothetical protein